VLDLVAQIEQDVAAMRTTALLEYMFRRAGALNADFSSGSVTSISGAPTGFDENATSWMLPRFVCGTCPGG
jgi:hypothetical protein